VQVIDSPVSRFPSALPTVLSGGQVKRASLGNELISDPSLLFLDEVTSGLDEHSDREMMTLFRQVAESGKTVVCITHSLANVERNCHLVVVLTPGGKPVLLGPGLGSIRLLPAEGPGIDPAAARDGLEVLFRAGGESLRVAPDGPTRKVKKLLQEGGIVPWMRDRLPIVCKDGKVVAVADLWIDADLAVENGLAVVWNDKPELD